VPVKPSDRSWLGLLAFFAVLTLGSSLVLAALLASVTMAIAGDESPQVSQASERLQVDPTIPGQTFSGIITDSQCGPRHTHPEQSASECAQMCVRNGSQYVLVDKNRTYGLTGNLEQMAQLAGQPAEVTGLLSQGMISVSSARLQEPGERSHP
jgi:hypothetical protein